MFAPSSLTNRAAVRLSGGAKCPLRFRVPADHGGVRIHWRNLLLTKIPIIIYYGDFIPKEPMANPGQDGWRVRLEMARKWRDAVNKRGGDVTVVHLPEVGIKGNTHFPFSDLNNLQVAELMSTWLNKKGLDKYSKRN